MFSRLSALTQKHSEKDDFLAVLHPCKPMKIQLQKLYRGIDNTRIDITLCPLFSVKARQLVRGILQHDATLNGFGRRVPCPKKADMDAFLKAYAGMMETAIPKAHKASSPDQIQLLQLGVIRFLLILVNDELDRLRDGIQRNRSGVMGQSGRRALELHEHMVTLAKLKNRLRNTVLQQLFTQIIKLETRSLRMVRKAVLGISWPLPKPVLCNPMLRQPLSWEDSQRVEPYLPLCAELFDQTNRLVTELFSAYLPNWALACDGEEHLPHSKEQLKNRARLHKPQSGMGGALEAETLLRSSLRPEEYLEGRFCWLDTPENIDLLTSRVMLGKALCNTKKREKIPAGWQDLQRHLRKRFYQQFKQSGLASQVLAAYGVREISQELKHSVPTSLMQRYLSEGMPRKELLQILARIKTEPLTTATVAKKLILARDKIKQIPRSEQEQLLLDYVKEFLVFRRDLKNAFLTYQAMDQLSILNKSEDIELSSTNNTLYRFVSTFEHEPEKQQACKHVIIKVDVRGSTVITAGLLAKRLNPATYFSLNLFKPISSLLESYGATKVFVEGDAIILSVLENKRTRKLSVSWACGLAQKILKTVDIQNIKNRQHGLPPLELGIGIAFSHASPAFLYDDKRRIMISSAINRADQLSSCSAVLRQSFSRQRGVEVMASEDHGMFKKEHPDRLLRFNVDGIELDKLAFDKLKTELKLKHLTPDASLDCDAITLHAGRYPDNRGTKHWLIIREAAVHYWADSTLGTEEEEGRCFYEVLTDLKVLGWVKNKIIQQRKRAKDSDAEPS